MGRAKLRTELITKEKDRNTTYRNRKNGIIKKAKELSVLCDVDTAIIVCPPGSKQPEIWPQNPDQIKNMIGSYKQEKNENRKRTYGLNDYFQDRKRKIEDELVRARERNVEAKYPTWFDDLNGLSEGQLRQFAIELENKTNTVKAHLESKKKNVQIDNNQPSSSHFVGSLDQVQTFNHDDDLLMSQLFNDLPYLFENNHPSVGSYPSLDEVQTLNPDLLTSQINARFNDMPDLQANYHYVGGSYTSLDQGGSTSGSMMSHDLGWFHDDAPTTWSIPPQPQRSGFVYPVFGRDVVYDHNLNQCPGQTLEQCGPMPEGQLRQFAIGLQNKNPVKSRHEPKKRNLNVQIKNNQPSRHSVGSLDQVEAFSHDDDLLMSQWFDDMPDLQMPFENNQPSNSSYPSLDQVQTLNPNVLMSQVMGRFNDMPDLQKQHGFNLGSNQQMANHSVGLYPSPDQGGSGSMVSHDFGWFNDAPTTWSIPERGGFGYPVSGFDVIYDNSKPCPCQNSDAGAMQSDAGGVGIARFT